MIVLRTIRHWRALLSIFIQDGLAYKVSGIIWVLTDASTAIVMPVVLGAAAKGGMIQGYDAHGFVQYYLTSLLITSFVTCHYMWEFASEIKEGVFTNYLLRPISYLQFMAARNLAWRMVRTGIFLPFFLIVIFGFQGQFSASDLHVSPLAFLAVILGHVVSFTFVMAMSTLALYLQEASSVFELYYIPMLFLSGQMFPMALFPDWVRKIAHITPFYYTTGFPTELLIGRIEQGQAWQGLAMQGAWIVLSYTAYQVSMRNGLKRYTGVGM